MDSVKIRNLLQEATLHMYSWTTDDLTSKLAQEVMRIGLAKIISFYQASGYDPNDVLVVFGPDGSITRNKSRFNSGVGYGCAVITKDYLFPSLLHPNGCGFGLYHVSNLPSLPQIMDRLQVLKNEGVPVGKQTGKWDVWKSNHFIDLLRLESLSEDYSHYEKYLPQGDYVLIHSSQQTEKQRLSYWEQEEFEKVDTPFGLVEGLPYKSGKRYLNYFQSVEEYSKNKRTSIAENLFGEDNITCISNPTHQGYYQENNLFTMRLGLYNSLDATGDARLPLFPIGFNGYSFIYLYEGKPNVNPEFMTGVQLKQSEERDHTSILKKINILPHGGGYKLLYPFIDVKTLIHNNEYYFELFQAPMQSRMIIQNVESLEYGYRGPSEVLPVIEKINLGKSVARFVPVQIIKY
ncbi:MAG: hypothetical protein ACW98F_02870 [Candidatus Hodarchaeales archaeon]|jgi:hypothetical protein